jgi:hypothetical protein
LKNKVFGFSGGIAEFPLHRRSFQRGGQFQAKPLQQDLLVCGGLADAPLP